jgi:hypothetical protein
LQRRRANRKALPTYVVDAVRDLYPNDADTAYVGFYAEKAPM